MKNRTKTIIFDLDGTLVDLSSYPEIELLADAELLRRLKPVYNFAIVTGGTTEETIFALEKTGIINLFDKGLIVTADIVSESKKTGASFLEIIKRINGRAIVIGDSDSDRIGAEKARLPLILLRRQADINTQRNEFTKVLKRAAQILDED